METDTSILLLLSELQSDRVQLKQANELLIRQNDAFRQENEDLRKQNETLRGADEVSAQGAKADEPPAGN